MRKFQLTNNFDSTPNYKKQGNNVKNLDKPLRQRQQKDRLVT